MKWGTLRAGGGNVGAPFSCPNYPIKSIQIVGTWGGATCTIQGSNIVTDPTYATLQDQQKTSLALTASGVYQIEQNTYYVRPNVTGGDSTTDLDVYLLCVTER